MNARGGQEWRNRDGNADGYPRHQPGSGDPCDENVVPVNSRGGGRGRGRSNRGNGHPRSSGDMYDHAGLESTDHEEHAKHSDTEQQQFNERRGSGRAKRNRFPGQTANGGGKKHEVNGTGVEESNGDHLESTTRQVAIICFTQHTE